MQGLPRFTMLVTHAPSPFATSCMRDFTTTNFGMSVRLSIHHGMQREWYSGLKQFLEEKNSFLPALLWGSKTHNRHWYFSAGWERK